MHHGVQHTEWYSLGSDTSNGKLQIAASIYVVQEELATGMLEVIMANTTLTTDPPGLTSAVPLKYCTFNFVVNNIPTGVKVHFT